MLLQRIKYFVAVAELGSFTDAAEACHISQSAISQQITALENELGVKLYKRSGRKFNLTPAGEYFFKRGKVVLQDVENLKIETARIASDDELNLSVGYLASYDGNELSATIAQFAATYPEVTITVFKGTHEDLYNALRSGKAALVVNDQRRAFSDEYENFVLKQSPTYVAFSANHPLAKVRELSTADLEKYPCIIVASKEQEKVEQDFYEKTLGIGKVFIFANTLDEAKLTALGGKGYMLIDKISVDEGKDLLLREVKRSDGSTIVRTYCAFWQKKRTDYYIEEFAETLRKNFSE